MAGAFRAGRLTPSAILTRNPDPGRRIFYRNFLTVLQRPRGLNVSIGKTAVSHARYKADQRAPDARRCSLESPGGWAVRCEVGGAVGARRCYPGYVRLVPVAAGVVALALAVSGCTGRANAARPPHISHTPGPPPAQLVIQPSHGHHVRPDKGVTVKALNGKITRVTVRAHGSSDPGTLSQSGTIWRTSYALHPDARYKVTATAVNALGKSVTKTATFTTLQPTMIMTPIASIFDGSAVGVGEPIVIQFDHPVASRKAVEQSLVLKTSTPVTGAWSWFGSQEVDFRPQSYWPAHSRVRLTFHSDGLRATDGAYATQNLRLGFTIGPRQITIVNTKTYRLKYYLDGKLLWNWPESSGMHEINPVTGNWFDTEDGTFLVLYKKNPEIMSSASFGIKSGPFSFPKIPVYYSVKFTPSGNYVHSAPWSVAEQGYANVSHGCVNLSPERAALYYARAQPGDIVVIKNSPVKATPQDITDWMYSWHQWLRQSKLGSFTTASLGSR